MVIIDEHDLGKTKVELLMDLLFESTGRRIPEKWITYGDPSELDARPEVLTDPNTFIPATVDGTYDFNLANALRGFMYRRRDLKKHFEGVTLNLTFPTWPMTLHQIIETQINPQLKYPLAVTDFVDYEITDRETTNLKIQAHPHSWFWFNEVDIAIVPPPEHFFVLFEIPHMPGFVKAPREITGAIRDPQFNGFEQTL